MSADERIETAHEPRAGFDYRVVFEQSPSLFLLLDPDLYIVTASDAYLEATMTERAEIIGRHLFEIFPDNPEDPEADGTRNLAASLDRVRHHRQPDAMALQKYDVRRPPSEGGGFEERWWSPVNTPVLDPSGRIVAIVHRVEDVTELVRLRSTVDLDEARANELEDERSSLEGLLFRRTRELEEAMDRLREVDRLKSDFLSRMSHELRTPLNAVIGFAQLLSFDELSSSQADSVERISKAGRHLLDLINEVLDIAQIESGHMSLSIEPLPLDDILAAAVELAGPLASRDGISLRTPDPEAELFVLADRQRLVQVVLNLLSNAVKYNRPGGSVAVSVVSSADRVRIEVTDTGGGIAAEHQARLFAPFERLGMEQTHIEGSGVGLMLSRRLAEHMGGYLELEESSEEGSTFVVDMPRVDAPAPARDGALAHVEDSDSPAISAPTSDAEVVVLYIEDNLSNLQLVEALLSHVPNVRLLTAMQGRLGVELATEHCPHLVLLDVHLPDINGDEVLARLRKHKTTESARVVFLSADAVPSHVQRALAAGGDAYLTKPFVVADLIAEIELARPTE